MKTYKNPFVIWLVAVAVLLLILGALGLGITLAEEGNYVVACVVGLFGIVLTIGVVAYANKLAPLREESRDTLQSNL